MKKKCAKTTGQAGWKNIPAWGYPVFIRFSHPTGIWSESISIRILRASILV